MKTHTVHLTVIAV